MNVHYMEYCSDSAYRARIQLAVLDHNAHTIRAPKQRADSQGYLYHRRYRKQTRNWDVVKVMERKEFDYIPEMLEVKTKFWKETACTTRKRTTLPDNHPSRIQRTIAHTEPPDTHTIVQNKQSRFT